MRVVAPLPPAFQWHDIAPEPSAQGETKRNLIVLLSELTGERALRRVAASLSRTSPLPAFTDSLAQERVRRRATLTEIEERRLILSVVSSPATQAAYAASGAGLFAGGIVASKVLPASIGRAVTVRPQPWPAGIYVSGSFP